MSRTLDQQRYSCALGAMQTVHAIDRALPILHSGPGCADKVGGGQGSSGYFSQHIYPCTNISEKEVIFGGEEKLRETIENALKVVDADLYVVLTSCTSEIIGDDVAEIVKSFSNAEKPVIYAATPGFKGNNLLGHEWILEAIIEQYLKPAEKTKKGLVNIWAGAPYYDPFWAGNLKKLEQLVSEIGLTPNTIFGYDRGIKNIDLIPQAEFNLLVSPWLGLSNVKLLKEKFGTPFLHYPALPIGANETSSFLRAVGQFAGLASEKVEGVILEHEREYYHYIERYADVFLETRVMAKRFVAVADAQYVLAFTKFLANDLGLIPSKQYITDNTPVEYQELVTSQFKKLNFDTDFEVSFSTDGFKIHEEIKNTEYYGYPLILGSSWEKKLSKETEAHYINVSWPVMERLVINGSYVGYDGGLKLIEDIYSVVLTRFN